MAQNSEKFFQSSRARGYITKQCFCEVEEVSCESHKNKGRFFTVLACICIIGWLLLLTVLTIVLGCWFLKLQKEVNSQETLLKACLADYSRLAEKVNDIKDTEDKYDHNGVDEIFEMKTHVPSDENGLFLPERDVLSRQKRSDENRRHSRRPNKPRGNRKKKSKKTKKPKKKKSPSVNRPRREQSQLLVLTLDGTGTGLQSLSDLQGKKYKNWQPDQDILQNSPSSADVYQYGHGEITILKTGVYFIYSQITYLTQYPTVSHSVQKVDDENNESSIMKCINAVEITQTDAASATARYCHCYVAKAVYLKANEKIFIRDDHGAHNSNEIFVTDEYGKQNFDLSEQISFKPDATYWGIFQLSET